MVQWAGAKPVSYSKEGVCINLLAILFHLFFIFLHKVMNQSSLVVLNTALSPNLPFML